MAADTFDPKNPPELSVSEWLNVPKGAEAPTLSSLKGRVVVLVAFQMLCPGCVEHALPQAKRIRQRFKDSEVAVLGLHSVFEHHDAMSPAALKAFMHQYRWPFPVGVDQADGKRMPRTMSAYQMQGTPSLLIFDRSGRLRRHYFGRPDDMLLACEIMALAIEPAGAGREQAIAIEKALADTLTMPGHAHGDDDDHHHHHGHEHGEACGCGHDHSHDHGHDHAHDHGHHHAHDHHHDHDHGHSHGKRR